MDFLPQQSQEYEANNNLRQQQSSSKIPKRIFQKQQCMFSIPRQHILDSTVTNNPSRETNRRPRHKNQCDNCQPCQEHENVVFFHESIVQVNSNCVTSRSA